MAPAALYAFTALFVGRLHELFPVLLAVRAPLVLGLASIAFALALPGEARHPLWRQHEARLVLSLVAIAVCFAPFSVWPGGSLEFLSATFSRTVIFFLLIVAVATSPPILRRLVLALVAGIGTLALFTIAGTSVISLEELGTGRAFASATYDPNDVALMMVCTIPFAVHGARALRGMARAFMAGAAGACALAVLMTLSRAGFIGLVVVALLCTLDERWRLRRHTVPALAVLALLAALATPARYWDVMATIFSARAEADAGTVAYMDEGLLPRLRLWLGGAELFLRHLMTGVGIGMYTVAEGGRHGGDGQWMTAHNSFVQAAVELGLLGIAIFVRLIATAFRNARTAARAAIARAEGTDVAWIAQALTIALVGYVVVGSSLSQAYAPMLYFLLALGVALRLVVAARDEDQTAARPAAMPRQA